MKTDVLAFIEDPGAANFIEPIVDELEARGVAVALRIDGKAIANTRRASIRQDESAEQLIARVSPRAVLVGTSENTKTLSLSLVDIAKRAGIATIGAVDALGNAEKRFRGESDIPLRHAPDRILVADEATAKAFANLGYPTNAINICGHPQHDAARAHATTLNAEGRASVRRRALPGASSTSRPVVAFIGEVSTGVGDDVFQRDANYTLFGSGRHHLRTEVVIEELLTAARKLEPKPYLVLRLHPKNTREEFAPFISEFDEVSAGGNAREVVYAADVVVGMTSMLLVEAQLLGCQVLSIVPRALERNWISELQAGLIPIATTSDQILSTLRQLIARQAPEEERARDVNTQSAAKAAAQVVESLLR